jgi:5,5'-dehydrodivanillate O-demethylase oxygenase subunit
MAAMETEVRQIEAGTEPWRDFAHTGPGTLAGRYLRLFWQPVQRAVDLPAGRAKPIRIMSEDFTLYRGEGGQPHLLAFRCAHRGTQLSTGWVEGDQLRCFYHGWKYDASGQCVEQPAEPEPFCQRIKIRSYPVQEYLGLIFAYLGEGEPPPLPRYPDFEAEGILDHRPAGIRACNFFQRMENSPDPVHLAFVHRRSPFADSGLIGIPQPSGEETSYGIEIRATRPNGKTRITHLHMPNINMIANSDSDPDEEAPPGTSINLSWRVPLDDEHTLGFNVSHLPLTGQAAERYRARRSERARGGPRPRELAEAILRGELHIDDIEDKTNIVGIEDYVAQVGQGSIVARENDHLGRSDILVLLYRQIWERELRALAEGRSLKQWHRPERVETVYGA